MSSRYRCFFLLIFVLLITWNCASALTLQLDGAIGVIPDHLLSGEDEVTTIIIEDGITAIGEGAFSCDPALRLAVIPSTIQQIGKDAFKQCGPMLLQCSPESAAIRYAQTMHIEYSADTTRRALLIGQSNYPSSYTLHAPLNDIDAVSHVLPGFEVTIVKDLTADELITAIYDAFAPGTVKEQDVSLLYYSGHGLENGSLLGMDLEEVTMSALHQVLDTIPGRKILILDCCYSGMYIPQPRTLPDSGAESVTNQFNDSVITEFSTGSLQVKRSEVPEDIRDYYVLTACAADELSWETRKGSRRFGVFTRFLSMGLGYDERDEVVCDRFADADNDGVITIREIFEYSKKEVAALNTPDQQNVQVYPTDADDYALYRADPRTIPVKTLGCIAYDACGGSSVPNRQLVFIGEPVQVSSVVPVLFGHRFDGWSSTKENDTAIVQPGETLTPSGSMTLYAIWTAINHELSGNNSIWFKGTEDGLTFSDRWQGDPINCVRVDGAELPNGAYTMSSDGRTIVLHPEWLNKQHIGKHVIEFLFADGMTVKLYFEIAQKIPATGDTGAPLLWLILSVCGIIILSRNREQHQ